MEFLLFLFGVLLCIGLFMLLANALSGIKNAQGTANRATEKAFTNDNAVNVSGGVKDLS